MTNQVVTYYVPVEGLWSDESQRALIEVWRRSWEKAGWVATVLTEADVATHPRFKFFKEHFDSKPSEHPRVFTTACFLRWLAAAHFGNLRGIDVLLSDYDVINYGFDPLDIQHDEMTIFCDEPPASIFCGAVLGSAQHFLDMCELFAAAKPCEHDYRRQVDMLHQDDLMLLSRMFETKTLDKPEWLVKRPGCALYDFSPWRTAKMVHFCYVMKQLNQWPKHLWIERLRKF